MRRFVIERDVTGIGGAGEDALAAAAASSNAAIAAMQAEGKEISWEHSYIAGDKTFCVYQASEEALIHEQAERSGGIVSNVTEIRSMLDPTYG